MGAGQQQDGEGASSVSSQARLQRGVASDLDQERSNRWPGEVNNSNNPNISSLQVLTVGFISIAFHLYYSLGK